MTYTVKIREQQYKDIFESLLVPVHVINDKFEIIIMNRAMKEWLKELGINPFSIGTSIFKVFPFLSQKIHDEYDYVLREGKPLFTEESVFLSNNWIKAEIRKIPIIRDGKVNQIITVIRDVTECKIAEKNLEESEEKFRTIAESSPLGIAILQDNMVKYVNKRWADLTGFKVEDIIHWKIDDFFMSIHPEDKNKVLRHAELRQKGLKDEVTNYIYRAIKQTGETVWFEVFANTIMYKGKPADLAITLEITEQIKAEQKLKESEENYRALYEEAPTAYFSIGTNKAILRNNKTAETLLGYTKEEFLKMKVFDLYFDSNQGIEKAKKVFKKFLNGESIKDKEIQMKKKNGDPIWVSLSVKPIVDPSGKVIESRSMVLDISERKLAQEEVKQSYKRLEELEYIIDNSPSIVFLWKNSEGWPVEFVSENVKNFGYTSEDFYSGKVLYRDIIHPDDLDRIAEEVQSYSNEDINEFIQEYRILTKDGEERWLEDRTWVRRNSDGIITHYQGIVLDITERKITEEALKLSKKKYKEAFDEANFYKDLFAHDINNILQVINSSAELISFHLGESDKSKDIKNLSDIIIKQIERGSKLVFNVRKLSDLEEKEISKEQIKICELLKKSIEYVKKTYKHREVNILVDSLDKKYIIMANELLQDIFENILINGIKYNDHLKVDILIKIAHQEVENKIYVKMEFIDNGIGIPDDRKEIIFKRGNRELKGSKGMGFGLSLISKIVNIFNGKIWVEDRVKGDYMKGSNFIVLLPES